MNATPRRASGRWAFLVGLVAVAGAASSSCAGDGCTAWESQCAGGVAMVCSEHQSDGPFDSTYTEWVTDDCGAPDRCARDSMGFARCTITPPLPSGCAEQG